MALKRTRTFRHHTDLPEVAQAANLALLILGAAKCSVWADLAITEHAREHLRLTRAQQELLDRHANLLPYLCRTPIRTIFVCPTCNRFAFIDKGTAPTRCTLTLSCDGKPVKAPATAARAETGGI